MSEMSSDTPTVKEVKRAVIRKSSIMSLAPVTASPLSSFPLINLSIYLQTKRKAIMMQTRATRTRSKIQLFPEACYP